MQYLFYLAAYIIGSISFSYILVKLKSGEDVREKGSKNAGGTNVLRNYGVAMGVATFLLDMAKGALVAFLAKNFNLANPIISVFFAVLGHIYPFYLSFKGGKGVATTGGGLGYLYPNYFLIGCVVFFGISAISGFVSLGSVSLMLYLLSIFFFIIKLKGAELLFACLTVLLVIFKHRENIKRLIKGNERSIYKRRNKWGYLLSVEEAGELALPMF